MCKFGTGPSNRRGSKLRIGRSRGFFKEMAHMNVDLKGMQEIARPGVGEKAFQTEREHHIQNPRRKKTSI